MRLDENGKATFASSSIISPSPGNNYHYAIYFIFEIQRISSYFSAPANTWKINGREKWELGGCTVR